MAMAISANNPPNAIITIDGTTYKFNAYGMRWGEIDQFVTFDSIYKNNKWVLPRGEWVLRGDTFFYSPPLRLYTKKRLLLLGDSIVLGWGVDTTAAEYLQRILPDWEVIPMGVGSWTTKDEVEWYLDVGKRFDPDVVVVIVCDNDTDERNKPTAWQSFKGRLLYSSYLLLTLKRIMMKTDPSKLNEAEVVRQLERMKPHAKRVVALRYASMNLDRYRLSRSDAHANLEGQKQIAKMIAKEIE